MVETFHVTGRSGIAFLTNIPSLYKKNRSMRVFSLRYHIWTKKASNDTKADYHNLLILCLHVSWFLHFRIGCGIQRENSDYTDI